MDKDIPEEKKVGKKRSTGYPRTPLLEAVTATKLLRENLGLGPYSRESAAKALGYSGVSGTSAARIAACVHFGLLIRKGNTYRQSALADEILLAVEDGEENQALGTAIKSPTLYRKLIDEFSGKALPKMLDNILVRNYGITEQVAKSVAANFRESAEYAGILANGVISVTDTPSDNITDYQDLPEKMPESLAAKRAESHPLASFSSNNYANESLPVKIPGTDVVILFPVDFAYPLSIGAFSEGIQKLAENIEKITSQDDKQSPTTEE